MSYEVIVVGGGIGGLTAAALLSARGVKVCLFERESQVGGCVANFDHLGYTFEPTAGLYQGWEPGGIYERIFSELPVNRPRVRRVSPAYVVRLADGADITAVEDEAHFERNLKVAFPECADAAVGFYRHLESPESTPSSQPPLENFLAATSPRFRSFIEAQLKMFAQGSSERCSYMDAAEVLISPRRGFFAMAGGAQSLATSLGEAIKISGGTIRLNTPVLRLAFGSDGSPVGVDLLSGETVVATRAIISNLTIWDTYGKLIGLSRTPVEIRAQLRSSRSWGAYLMFIAMDESVNSRLSSDHVLVVQDRIPNHNDKSPPRHFVFAAAPQWDKRAPDGKRAVTVFRWTEAEEWFAFHEDNEEHEKMDQKKLEESWLDLHAAMPELGDGVEIIETATPKTFYERTRRTLGMVGHPASTLAFGRPDRKPAILPNMFIVGDTVSFSFGIASVSSDALLLVNSITGPIEQR